MLLPFSEPALPDKRAEYVARGNRVLGGIATSGSLRALTEFLCRARRRRDLFWCSKPRDAVSIWPLRLIRSIPRVASMARRADLIRLRTRSCARHSGAGRIVTKPCSSCHPVGRRAACRSMTLKARSGHSFGSGSTKNAQGIDLRGRVRGIAESAVKKFGESRASKPVVQITPPRGRSAPEENPEQAAVEARSGAAALSFVSLKTLTHMTIARKIALVENLLFPGAWLVTGRPKIGNPGFYYNWRSRSPKARRSWDSIVRRLRCWWCLVKTMTR